MTRDEAFLADVCANPDDDAPRLIYADWLEDIGRVERAEFIRAQCELARMTRDDPRRRTLVSRTHHLRQDHEVAWLGPLRDWLESWTFRRGFVEKATLTASSFAVHVGELFRRTPLLHLRLQIASALVPTLIRFEQIHQLHTLDVSGCNLSDADAEALSRCPQLEKLRELRLNFNRIGDRGAVALTTPNNLRSLLRLQVMANPISGVGQRRLTDRFGERVAFICDRDEDHAYVLQPSACGWETGRTADGRQALMLCDTMREVRTIFFDEEGGLLDMQTRRVEQPALTYQEREKDWSAVLHAWQKEIGFREGTIYVKQFETSTGEEPRIDAVPTGRRRILLDPANHSLEARQDNLNFLINTWEPAGNFVFNWGNDYWMNRIGKVETS